jgi:hypothetical protein
MREKSGLKPEDRDQMNEKIELHVLMPLKNQNCFILFSNLSPLSFYVSIKICKKNFRIQVKPLLSARKTH